MQMVDQSGSVAESAFRLFRLLVNFLIFLAIVRWGIRSFLLNLGALRSLVQVIFRHQPPSCLVFMRELLRSSLAHVESSVS